MKIFLSILYLLTPVIAFEVKSNVYFNIIEEYKESTETVIYKLSIKNKTDFLEFIDERFDMYLVDVFSNNELIFRNLTFRTKREPNNQVFLVENLMQNNKSRTVFKFNLGRFLFMLTKFCKSKCQGQITLLNFRMSGWNSKRMPKNVTKYSQIDAYLTLCKSRGDEYLESCEDEFNVDDEVNYYALFLVLLMILTMNLTVIMIKICEYYYKQREEGSL